MELISKHLPDRKSNIKRWEDIENRLPSIIKIKYYILRKKESQSEEVSRLGNVEEVSTQERLNELEQELQEHIQDKLHHPWQQGLQTPDNNIILNNNINGENVIPTSSSNRENMLFPHLYRQEINIDALTNHYLDKDLPNNNNIQF